MRFNNDQILELLKWHDIQNSMLDREFETLFHMCAYTARDMYTQLRRDFESEPMHNGRLIGFELWLDELREHLYIRENTNRTRGSVEWLNIYARRQPSRSSIRMTQMEWMGTEPSQDVSKPIVKEESDDLLLLLV